MASVRGKTTASLMIKNKSQQIMLRDIPELEEQMVELYVDLFYVNGIPFVHTKSKEINYITIQKLNKRTTGKISRRLKNVMEEWEANPISTLGFIVSVVVKN